MDKLSSDELRGIATNLRRIADMLDELNVPALIVELREIATEFEKISYKERN
jgi:hypothetical protein